MFASIKALALVKSIICIAAFFCVAVGCLASENPEFKAGSNALRNIYDGDTFNLAFRLAHIDTPEIKGKCDHEKALAIKARDFTRDFLTLGKEISVTVIDTGYYGRPIVEVRNQFGYLNEMLVKEGLAVYYNRNKKHDWCAKTP